MRCACLVHGGFGVTLPPCRQDPPRPPLFPPPSSRPRSTPPTSTPPRPSTAASSACRSWPAPATATSSSASATPSSSSSTLPRPPARPPRARSRCRPTAPRGPGHVAFAATAAELDLWPRPPRRRRRRDRGRLPLAGVRGALDLRPRPGREFGRARRAAPLGSRRDGVDQNPSFLSKQRLAVAAAGPSTRRGPLTETGVPPMIRPSRGDKRPPSGVSREETSTMKAIHGLTALAVLFGSAAWAGPEIVSGPGADPECFEPWDASTKYFQWEKKDGPYRIALVNGFVGNTWRIQMIKMAKTFAEDPVDQGQDQGIQGRLHRHRRARPARRHRGLHQPGLRRDRHHRRLARRLRPGDPPRRQEQRRPRALRQRPRHRQGDAGQRGPDADGPQLRPVRRRPAQGTGQDRRQDPRGPRRARQLGRPRPLGRHPRGLRRDRRQVGHRPGRRHVGRRHRPEGDRRRHRRARPLRRLHRPGRHHRRRPGDDGRRPPLRAGRRRDRERLPQARRQALRPRA